MKPLATALSAGSCLALSLSIVSDANAANILYLNSTRGSGTGSVGNFRSAIADTLDNYGDGSEFEVDFIQTHTTGDLAHLLTAKPIDHYDQIWFDTTILRTSLLSAADLTALNDWAFNNTLEFILDSSFFARSRMTAAAQALTVNQALALQGAGGGIFIGTDGSPFSYTANQILTNFGFDSLFSDHVIISANGNFVGDLLLGPVIK